MSVRLETGARNHRAKLLILLLAGIHVRRKMVRFLAVAGFSFFARAPGEIEK